MSTDKKFMLEIPNLETLRSLTFDDKDKPESEYRNLETIFSTDPEYRDCFRFDEFNRLSLWRDTHLDTLTDVRIHLDLHRRYGIRFRNESIRRVSRLFAMQNSFHPVKDYLTSLEWDGVPRLPKMLQLGFGGTTHKNQTDALLEDVGRKFCLSLVARLMNPQTPVDSVLVLQGKQSSQKSEALRALCPKPEWYSNEAFNTSKRELRPGIRGKWLYVVEEIDSYKKSDQEDIKMFLSRREDPYRALLALEEIYIPRSTVFAATTSMEVFRDAAAGHPRYVLVSIDKANPEWIRSHRDQLWAEAVVRYDRGEEATRLKRASVDFQVTDGWSVLVLEAIFNATNPPDGFFTNERILTDWINVPKDRITKREKNRIAAVMKQLGIKQVRLQQMREALRLGYTHAPMGYHINDSVRSALLDTDNVVPFRANEEVF